jgi:hypothetical protein
MRLSLPACVICVFALFSLGSIGRIAAAQDDEASLAAARAEARCDLAAAKAAARYYWQVVYPQQQRDLDAAIELTEAEVKADRMQLHQYEPFDHFSYGAPLYMPIQNLQICQREVELRLDRLRDQRNALIRFNSDQGYVLDTCVATARARLVALEGGEVIEIGATPVAGQ